MRGLGLQLFPGSGGSTSARQDVSVVIPSGRPAYLRFLKWSGNEELNLGFAPPRRVCCRNT